MFNCSSNLFRFSLAVNGGAAATACGERLRLEMGTAFKTGKEASVGLWTQCSQGFIFRGLLGASAPCSVPACCWNRLWNDRTTLFILNDTVGRALGLKSGRLRVQSWLCHLNTLWLQESQEAPHATVRGGGGRGEDEVRGLECMTHDKHLVWAGHIVGPQYKGSVGKSLGLLTAWPCFSHL